MHEFSIELLLKIWLIIPFLAFFASSINADSFSESSFSRDWILFSSEKTSAGGNEISNIGFKIGEFYKTNVPKTVFAALVDNGVYQKAYYGENLLKFSKKPFEKPWWYRKEFDIEEINNVNYQVTLEGINYQGELWINGEKIAGIDKIIGAFGRFNFDITKYLIIGKNAIAIEVFPPELGDFTLGFVDWNPSPPDNNMGLWRGVKLKKTGKVSLDDIFVMTKVNKKTLKDSYSGSSF